MPIYLDNAQGHPDQGMTLHDINATMRVAQRRNEIIMFRDTGCWSRPYIEAGHPTKPFHVKGKSSTWGPHAGLIPYNSEFSKAFHEKDIAKGLRLNKEGIAGNYARPINAYITESFINSDLLVRKGSAGRPPVDRITRPRGDVIYFFCTKPNGDSRGPGKKYILLGKKVPGGRYQLFTFPGNAAQINERELFLKESSAEPMLVMTVPGADKPITGDYDLFAVCPSWASYGSQDKKMDPTLDNPQQNASFKRTQSKAADPLLGERAQQSLASIKAAFTAEDPDRGNLTPRILAVIKSLQMEMGGPFPRVHHNAESGRPFAPGAEDGFPVTTFHPRSGIGGYSFRNAVIDNVGDLRDYFTRLYMDGYYPPRNHAWNMNSLRDDSAIKAKLTRLFVNPR